MSANPKLTFD